MEQRHVSTRARRCPMKKKRPYNGECTIEPGASRVARQLWSEWTRFLDTKVEPSRPCKGERRHRRRIQSLIFAQNKERELRVGAIGLRPDGQACRGRRSRRQPHVEAVVENPYRVTRCLAESEIDSHSRRCRRKSSLGMG